MSLAKIFVSFYSQVIFLFYSYQRPAGGLRGDKGENKKFKQRKMGFLGRNQVCMITKSMECLFCLHLFPTKIVPTYNGNRNCQERLKRGLIQARLMVRECAGELEKSRQAQSGNAIGGTSQQ